MMGMMGEAFGASGLFGAGVTLAVAAVGLAIGARVRESTRRVSPTSSASSSLEALKLRLVRGEIDPDTYEEIRAHLSD
ncbi:hypothetical protein [Sulfobacillus harzensis]|uniref:SHOCT domain-containing protein n=1 Tax=Sulfobacillus harzensis TaxID=2729629 RepID=A0A7Y0Q4F0_9FIRM|nr:hypothetical protein [Sulfobacillus harzensis]NMP24557.1 hypothetical protein [Sulfobacillus harzensis]